LTRSALLALVAFSLPCEAQDRLISGPGSTLTENKCRICHELEHIRRSPLSRGEWADNLRNMKERGAPMDEAEMATILDYLSTYYSRDQPAPPPSRDTLASADGVEGLLQKNGCAGCHALGERLVGPSFKQIAAKYAQDGAAQGKLANKIRNGGQGVWGSVPMPPNPGLDDAELKTIVAWLLQRR
jgi:cytochrome c551/c552